MIQAKLQVIAARFAVHLVVVADIRCQIVHRDLVHLRTGESSHSDLPKTMLKKLLGVGLLFTVRVFPEWFPIQVILAPVHSAVRIHAATASRSLHFVPPFFTSRNLTASSVVLTMGSSSRSMRAIVFLCNSNSAAISRCVIANFRLARLSS